MGGTNYTKENQIGMAVVTLSYNKRYLVKEK